MQVSIISPLNNGPQFISLPSRKRLNRVGNYKANVSCRASSAYEKWDTMNMEKMLSLECKNYSSKDEIKKAYRKMALLYHPDVCDPSRRDECTKQFVELQDTYRILLDQASRKSCSKDKGFRGWESQLVELSRRSEYNWSAREEKSWGCRMRAQHRCACA